MFFALCIGYVVGVVSGAVAFRVWIGPKLKRPRSIAEWMEREVSTAGVVFAGQPATIALDHGSLKLWNASDSRVEYWLRVTRDPDAKERRREYKARNQDIH